RERLARSRSRATVGRTFYPISAQSGSTVSVDSPKLVFARIMTQPLAHSAPPLPAPGEISSSMLERLKAAESAVQECLKSLTPAESPAPPKGELVGELELSVVMPCLNEADTLAICIDKAMEAMRTAGI